MRRVTPAGSHLQCTDRAGLILPIAAKEPLSDKKLKQKDYLGSVIFPTLHLLLKATSTRPGNAGNWGPTWATDGPNPAQQDSPELHVGAGGQQRPGRQGRSGGARSKERQN